MTTLIDWLNRWLRRRPPEPQPPPPPPPTPTSPDVAAVLPLINQARARHGLHPLAESGVHRQSAQAHAGAMAARGYAFHQPFVAEIVARGQRTAAEAVSGWMQSPGHRAVVLGPYRSAGAGAAEGRDGFTYWAVVFGG